MITIGIVVNLTCLTSKYGFENIPFSLHLLGVLQIMFYYPGFKNIETSEFSTFSHMSRVEELLETN